MTARDVCEAGIVLLWVRGVGPHCVQRSTCSFRPNNIPKQNVQAKTLNPNPFRAQVTNLYGLQALCLCGPLKQYAGPITTKVTRHQATSIASVSLSVYNPLCALGLASPEQKSWYPGKGCGSDSVTVGRL